MLYVIASVVIGTILLSTLMIYKQYNLRMILGGKQIEASELNDQQILTALDRLVIKYHSLAPDKLAKALEQYNDAIEGLFWCDLTRLYAFSSEDEAFRGFIKSLTDEQWSAVLQSYKVFELDTVSQAVLDLDIEKDEINLEQAEHFRYSIRSANDQMQQKLCIHVRLYIDNINKSTCAI